MLEVSVGVTLFGSLGDVGGFLEGGGPGGFVRGLGGGLLGFCGIG